MSGQPGGGKLEAALARFGLAPRSAARARGRRRRLDRRVHGGAARPRRRARGRRRRRPRPAARLAARRPARDLAGGRRLEAAVTGRSGGAVRLLHRRRQLRRRAQHAARPGVPPAPRRRGRRAGQAAVRAGRQAGQAAGADDANLRARRSTRSASAGRGARLRGGRARRLAGRGRQRHDGDPRAPALRRAPGVAARRASEARRRRRARRERARARGAAWFAVVAPGLGGAARGRSRRCRTSGVGPDGGVEWSGPPAAARANLWLRVATRVLARVGEVEAREFGKLRHRAARLPWGRFVAPGATVAVRASATQCRLYHTGAIAEAACSRSATPSRARAPPRTTSRPTSTMLVRGVDDGSPSASTRRASAAPARRAHRDRRGAAARDAGRRAARARGLAAGDAARRPDVRRGHDPIEAGAQALGLAPGRRARLRARALAACHRRRDAPGWPRCAPRRTPAPRRALARRHRRPIVGSDRDAS